MHRRSFLRWSAVPLVAPLFAGLPAWADAASLADLQAFRAAFERPRSPLAPEIVTSETRDGLVREKLLITSEPGTRVPFVVVRAAGDARPRPAVICLHGLGGNKEGMASYTDDLARRGFVGVAIDARYHGDRAGDVQRAMGAAFRTGKEHPYLWDTVWDTWRVMDYLETRPDVDRGRIGVMGISLGGHTTWMVSADPRVKVAVPCIAVCSWRWQLEHEGYTQRVKNLSVAFDAVKAELGEKEVTPKVVAEAWRRWLPGIPEKFDCQDLLAAFAPKPLLILNGDSDPVAPLEGVKLAVTEIEGAYRRAGASDHLRVIIAEKSGHTVTTAQREALFEWLDRWLKASPDS
ncbi:MAG: Dienelactone hydrolase family protein [Armatimonadetes bacterium]|jgi:dienelactone hydrolase|nr:Dienelactone hydrolase family protein [Armatimonadota bacterium]